MSTTKNNQTKMTPAKALEQLQAGNERFLSGKTLSRDFSSEIKETAAGQYPFAVILGCIDSRATAEQLFDQGVGDLFNARVAGNIVNEDILGSLEYACNVAGSKLILVLGHTACGAVTAATQNVELGNITALLSKITPVVDSLGQGVAVDKVAEHNVQHSIMRIRKESAILKDMEESGKIIIKGAMYDVATGEVRFLD
jgi:carbonic anhydrase